MNKRLTALLLALALSLSVGMVSALADEETRSPEENAAAAAAEKTETADAETPAAAEEAPVAEEPPLLIAEKPAGKVIRFADLESLVTKNSPAYAALAAQIGYIEEAEDYVEDLQDTLKTLDQQIEGLKDGMEALNAALALTPDDAELQEELADAEKALKTMQEQRTQLQTGISGLGSLADQDTTQMEASLQQIVMGCQSLYIGLVNLEIQDGALVRQIASLERTLKELKLRQEWGQVSQLQVMEIENGLSAATSGLATLRMNATNLTMQLEQMIGEEIAGTVTVDALPVVTTEQLNTIDVEADLKTVLRKNPDVQAANNADNDAWSMGKDSMSKDMWDALDDANDYTLKNAKQQVEIKLRTLYATLLNDRQAVETAKAALEAEQLSCAAAALKYQQGTISLNALQTADDDLQTAKEAVTTAEITLFTTYNQYNWAVEHGILS